MDILDLTIRAVFIKDNGLINVVARVASKQLYSEDTDYNGQYVVWVDESLDTITDSDLQKLYYVKNKEFKLLPDKPSEYHIWDLESEQWQYSEELYNTFITRKENEVKATRNGLLAQSDYTELPSFLQRNGETVATEWQTYRQALRDITQQSGYPLDVIWPTPPS